MSADAFHITGPAESGEGGAAMKNALNDAQLNPDQIGYLNAHGTSTPLGDIAETKGVKQVFGADTDLRISSTKSMIGHLLGAAGSVEAIMTIMALNQRFCRLRSTWMSPTRNAIWITFQMRPEIINLPPRQAIHLALGARTEPDIHKHLKERPCIN